jgi:glycosyltransferase involved in cell wall biosynthesis
VNVGLIVPGFSADDSDWCIPALRHLARTLARTDRLRVIALRYPYTSGRYAVDGVEVVSLGGALSHGVATAALWRDALALLRAEHRRERFDVLHAFWATESGFLTAFAGRLLRVRTLVSLAGGELVALRDIGYGDQRLAVERLKVAAALRLSSAISAGSRLLAERAERHVRRRVHLAPLGVDTNLFAPQESQPSARLLHVGTLTSVKDHLTLLRAFQELRSRRTELTLQIVGDGPLRPHLEELARELGVDRYVCFRGDVAHTELPDIYRGADVFVLSSRHEAQGMVALEAAACGIPVAGTHVGILPEITPHTAPARDARALADAIAAALSEGEACGRVRAEYSLEACTNRFRQLYAGVV